MLSEPEENEKWIQESTESSSNNCEEVKPRKESAKKWCGQQIASLAVTSLAMFLTSFGIAVFPPFFPKLAESKNSSASIYGFLLGLDSLVTFLVTPPIANNLFLIGPHLTFVFGVLTSGITCVATGTLEFVHGGLLFQIVAALVRTMNAVGCSACLSAFFAILNMEFPRKSAQMFAFTRTLMNAGSLLGPSVGGFLMHAGGFKIPFFVAGGLQFLVGVAALPLLLVRAKKLKCAMSLSKSVKPSRSAWYLLTLPPMWVPLLTFLLSSSLNGFISVCLDQHILKPFELAEFVTGLFFSLRDLVNFLATPLWAVICEHTNTGAKIWVVAATLSASLSVSIIGILPLFSIQVGLAGIGIALCLNGLGFAGQQVAGVADATDTLCFIGLDDDPAYHGLIAGLWSAMSGAGRFVSRTATGILLDTVGFSKTSFVVLGTQLAVVIVALLAHFVTKRDTKPTKKVDAKGTKTLASI